MEQADCDGIDLKWMHPHSSDEETDDIVDVDRDGVFPVKYYTHELSLRGRFRRFFIRNPTSRIYNTVFDLVAKSILCLLYVVRVCMDDHKSYACAGEPCPPSVLEETSSGFTSTNINWYVLLWVDRHISTWIIEVVICVITFVKACLYFFATKGNLMDRILSQYFLLEVLCSVPTIATVCYPMLLKNMFVPLFLNCWLARVALKRLMNDLHLTKQRFQTMSVTLYQQMWFLTVTLCCLVFTTICGIQHIQRSSHEKPLNMFEAVYFVIITFSTVGYGDIAPDIWLGQLFMFVMICIGFAFIPKQLEEIGSTWAQRKKTGGDYKKRKNKHVIVCATFFTTDSVMNFLNEFYEHQKSEGHTVVLMSSEELDGNMLFILKDPKWANRVLYLCGSALKDIDLKRCRVHEAEAVFFILNKNCADRNKADQHTILRSWAVKDFAPHCRQYIQLFKATNKLHVRFAEHVVCEDEFKYALLANNCLYPGLSTLVTLILHTSRGKEGELATEPWQQVYGRHSGNEIYHIQLSRSDFFRRYEGQRFSQASAAVHQSLGVCLLAVLDSSEAEPRLRLNPGPDYILKGMDYCFYMSLTKEEYSRVTNPMDDGGKDTVEERQKNMERLALQLQQWLQSEGMEEAEVEDEESIFNTITSSMPMAKKMRADMESLTALPLIFHTKSGSSSSTSGTADLDSPNHKSAAEFVDRMYGTTNPDRVFQQYGDVGQDSFTTGPLPSSMPVGNKRIICHLHATARPLCCLEWGKDCAHCTFKNASDKRWDNHLIIVSIDDCSPAVYNFIVPLRSNYLSLGSLSPIIFIVDEQPDQLFLETIAHFPLVFWMVGSLQCLDDLLKAGIRKAIHLVISHLGTQEIDHAEETLGDAETIVMVQKISRLFPMVNIITEVNEATNMRFMHFQAQDSYLQEISRLEKRLKEHTTSNMPYMFRLPFAAGQVFSSTMLDRLMYQTFVKGYLINFVRLMLGIDAQENSGHLSSVRIKRQTIAQFPTYGALYQGLCSTTGEIPIAIYRTDRRGNSVFDAHASNENNNAPAEKRGRPSMVFVKTERDLTNLSDLINDRLQRLELACDEPYEIRSPTKTLSYVIVNPSPKRKLKCGDMIYVLQPSSMVAVPNKINRRSPAKPVKPRHLMRQQSDGAKHRPLSDNVNPRVTWSLAPASKMEQLPEHSGNSSSLHLPPQRKRSKSESARMDREEEHEMVMKV